MLNNIIFIIVIRNFWCKTILTSSLVHLSRKLFDLPWLTLTPFSVPELTPLKWKSWYQLFFLSLSTSPRYWKASDCRIRQIISWQYLNFIYLLNKHATVMDLPLMDLSPHIESHFKSRNEGKIKKQQQQQQFFLNFILGDQT